MGVAQLLRRLLGQSQVREGDGDHPEPVPDPGFHDAFEQHPSAMVFVGPSLQILTVNAAFSRMFGYQADELASRTLHDLMASGVAGADLQALERGRLQRMEALFTRRTGEQLWVELSASA